MQIPLWTTLILVVQIKHTKIYFLKCSAQDYECKKKVENDYLDGSTLALLFIRANGAGAAVSNKLLWIPDISLKIDLWLTSPGTENPSLPSIENFFQLKRPDPSTWSPPWHNSHKKSHWFRSIWLKKSFQYLIKNIVSRN